MKATVSRSGLLDAYLAVNAAQSDSGAYVERASGRICLQLDEEFRIDEDEELPDDLDDETLYAAVPGQGDLDLGQPLVYRFVREHLPGEYDRVRDIFHRRGAWRNFKDLLDRKDRLDAWHAFSDKATHRAWREWAQGEGFEVRDDVPRRGPAS